VKKSSVHIHKNNNSAPVRKEFLIFGSPAIEQPEIDEVVKCLKSGRKNNQGGFYFY